MAIGFRVGIPGARVRVSTRGVRCSIGPRIARVHVGTGRTRVSTGMGPFFASTALGGSGSRRSYGPTPAQLAARERAALRTQAQEERLQAIRELAADLDRLVHVHRGHWPPNLPPRIPVPAPDAARAREEAVELFTRGLGVLKRRERAQAKERAEAAAEQYLRDEAARLEDLRRQLQQEADAWWSALTRNEEPVVVQALNTAFADNPAGGVALGVDGDVVSVLLRQPDLSTLPEQRPDTTPAGKPTMRRMSQRDRHQLLLRAMVSNVAATLREGFAVAPALQAMTVCVVTRSPRTQQLGAVLLGRWTRHDVDATAWGSVDDAWGLVLDRAQELQTDLSSTGEARPLRDVGLDGLMDLLVEDDAEEEEVSGADAPAPAVRTFGEWWREQTRQQVAAPASPPAASDPPVPQSTPLARGQALALDDRDLTRPVLVEVAYPQGAAELDLSVLLLATDGRVRRDEDLVFYNAPSSPGGSVIVSTDPPWHGRVVVRARLDLSLLPHEGVVHVAVILSSAAALDLRSVLPPLLLAAGGPAYALPFPAEPGLTAAVVAEVYLKPAGWRLRAPAQGWSDGLGGLVRSFGVDAT